MAQDQHFITMLAQELHGQLNDDARKLGPAVLGTNQPDSHRVPRDKLLAYVRSSWSDPQFRQQLLQQMGSRNFLAIANEAMAPVIEAWKEYEQQAIRQRVSMAASNPGMLMAPPQQAPQLMAPQAQGPSPMAMSAMPAMPVSSAPQMPPGMGG